MSDERTAGLHPTRAASGTVDHLSSPAPVLLEGRRIYKEFPSGEGRLEVLRGVDFALARGETVSIVGESGAGKSTLLQILGGLDRPTRGQVVIRWSEGGGGRREGGPRPVSRGPEEPPETDLPLWGGQEDGAGEAYLQRLDDIRLSRVRNRLLGFVFQFHHLLMEFSALENVMMPLLIQGKEWGEARERALAMLERVGLSERASHKPRALSGGEQQRVAVGRAIVHRPRIVLADEPSGNLDRSNSARLHALLFELAREEGIGFVVVTHNRELAAETDRSLLLEGGVLHAV
jgi:lipoprotein-releasing system ATP-binding protein